MNPTPPTSTSAAVRHAVDSALRALHAAGDDSLEAAAGILAVHGRRLLECDCVVSVIHPANADRMRIIAGAGAWAESQVGRRYSLAGTLHARALATREPVVSDDVPTQTPLPEAFAAGGITQGLLIALPTSVGFPDGRPGAGVVSFWRTAGRFEAGEIDAAREFVAIAGATLARGELLRAYRTATDGLKETVRDLEGTRIRLQQAHARALEALTSVSRHVDAGGPVTQFFGQMSTTVAGLVDAERVGFARLTPRGGLRPVLHAYGVRDEVMRSLGEMPIRPDGARGIERVVNTGVTVRLRLEDIPADDMAAPDALRAMAQRDLVITRWSAGDRVLGILAAYDCRRPGGFTDEDALVLEICARATGLVWEQVRSRRHARTAEARRVAEMAENVERMRSLVGSALDGIVSIDTDGRILDLNGAAEELFGCQADEAIGKPLAELFIPPELREKHLAALQRHIDAPQPSMLFRRLETEAMRADGSRFDAEIAVVRTTWSGRVVYTGFVRDVTQQRRAAEREREQAAHVAGLEQAKTQLLNLASHELRGPLGILNGYLAMIEEGALGDLPADLAQVVPLLRTKVTEMNSLVDGMLDAARLDDEHLRLTTAPTDVREVVTRAVEQVAAMRRDRHRTRIELPAEPVIVAGDSVRLVQVVGNLVHNALKYSPQGGDVKVSLSVENASALVSVEDHGLGIDSEDLPRLFTRFGRIVNRHNSHIPGTGLGLYLARELARMHSGDITVTSIPRAGSVFLLSLPIAQD